MTTYAYTGTLADAGEAPFPDAVPNLYVVPLQDTFGPAGGVLASRRISIAVATNGTFSVRLVASVDLTPQTKYELRCDWLDAAGNLRGWASWKFTAAIGGGPISQMKDVILTRVWYSTSRPPVDRQGIYWINPETGDVREWVEQ